ncbi:hypothetical protein Naga_100391g1 [Nannochloropsis gaditana]|uniref:Uncharacterized protein n=1 Tax=Nannochloropsis gaditana TaxID=72520 RepID=W7UB98_9STRA|nr:hypothetical protein Naga_100391g1 [Nannochloropsis gaditana]
MPSLPLPALSIKGAKAREYKAFDGGEHNSLPSTFSDPTASASTHANVGHGDPASTGGVGEAYPTACASAHRPSWGPQGARHSSFGIGNEGLDRSRRGDQEGRGCCRRMTSFQISYLVVMLASMFYFISDALGSRRVLLWLEGILVSTHPQTAGMTTALLLSLGSVMVALGFPTTFLALLGGHVYR